jgi:hypothetical protein
MFLSKNKHETMVNAVMMVFVLLSMNVIDTAYAECPQPIMMELIKNKYKPDEIVRICQDYSNKDRCCCQFTTIEKESILYSTQTTRKRIVKHETTESRDGLSHSTTKTWTNGDDQPSLASANWVEKHKEFKWVDSILCGGISKPTERSTKRRKIVSQCIEARTCGK